MAFELITKDLCLLKKNTSLHIFLIIIRKLIFLVPFSWFIYEYENIMHITDLVGLNSY